MKFKKRSLAKTFRNTSFRLFALQPSTGKMIKRVFIILPVEGCSANSRKLVFLKVLAGDRFLNFINKIVDLFFDSSKEKFSFVIISSIKTLFLDLPYYITISCFWVTHLRLSFQIQFGKEKKSETYGW